MSPNQVVTYELKASVLVVEYGPLDKGEDPVLVPGSYFPVPYFWPNIFSTPQVSVDGISQG